MSRYGVVAGLNSIATLATCGAISLSSSTNLPANVGSETLKPVTLPPGRGKLATKPLPTGSATTAKMAPRAATPQRRRAACAAIVTGAHRLPQAALLRDRHREIFP